MIIYIHIYFRSSPSRLLTLWLYFSTHGHDPENQNVIYYRNGSWKSLKEAHEHCRDTDFETSSQVCQGIGSKYHRIKFEKILQMIHWTVVVTPTIFPGTFAPWNSAHPGPKKVTPKVLQHGTPFKTAKCSNYRKIGKYKHNVPQLIQTSYLTGCDFNPWVCTCIKMFVISYLFFSVKKSPKKTIKPPELRPSSIKGTGFSGHQKIETHQNPTLFTVHYPRPSQSASSGSAFTRGRSTRYMWQCEKKQFCKNDCIY